MEEKQQYEDKPTAFKMAMLAIVILLIGGMLGTSFAALTKIAQPCPLQPQVQVRTASYVFQENSCGVTCAINWMNNAITQVGVWIDQSATYLRNLGGTYQPNKSTLPPGNQGPCPCGGGAAGTPNNPSVRKP